MATPTGAAQFLGSDSSLLAPGSEGQAGLVYFNPSVQWNNYHAVLVQPVEFWDADQSQVSQSDQQMLCGYFYNKIKEQLAAKNIAMADQPGPGVATLQVAIINATSATPGLRSISVLIPLARKIAPALEQPRKHKRRTVSRELRTGYGFRD